MNEVAKAPAPGAELAGQAISEFEKPLMSYALSLLRDVERARDVVQDTFFRLCQQDPRKIRQGIKPWLYTVCRNRAFDLMKRESRMISVTSETLNAVRSEQLSPAEHSEREEAHAEVLRLLQELPENQREVIRLRFQSDLSYREISEITKLSVSNVGFLLHTGLKQLRGLVTQRI